MTPHAIGFIGAGQMARALAAGFVRPGLVKADQIIASDPVPAAGQALLAAVPGANIAASNAEVARQAQILFLAVKPQTMSAVLAELKPVITPEQLVVSIAAGLRISTLAAGLSSGVRLIRVMPNTPCLVGQSASAYALSPQATKEDGQRVAELLCSVGKCFQVEEKLLDAVTGLSGSGPAFVYVLIEALADGGVRVGLPRDVSLALAAQTVRGAAEMVLTTGEHPGVLKDKVASPGGTTIAGLAALERGGLRSAVISAVEAATARSIELGSV